VIPGILAVRTPTFQRPVALLAAERAPILIAVGLFTLLAAAWLPAVPVVTAMAILALGATYATLARFRGTPAIVPVMLVHTAAYVTLYGLFLGAALHADTAATTAGLSLWAALDVAASAVPMAIALQRIAGRLRQNLEPKR
jgi:hypothetical protein